MAPLNKFASSGQNLLARKKGHTAGCQQLNRGTIKRKEKKERTRRRKRQELKDKIKGKKKKKKKKKKKRRRRSINERKKVLFMVTWRSV